MNDLYHSYIMSPVNGLMQDNVMHLDSQLVLWISFFLLSVSVLLNYYLYTFLKYNKSIMQVVSSNPMLEKTPTKSPSSTIKSPPCSSAKEVPPIMMTNTQVKEQATTTITLVSNEIDKLTDEEILGLVDHGKLQLHNLENSLDNFERAIFLRRLYVSKFDYRNSLNYIIIPICGDEG
jgi:hypothetical protein